MGVLKLFEGTGDFECVVATIKTPEGSLQKVVDGTSFSIGRAPDCVLSIPHAGISRLHIVVTIKRGEVYIMDQESSNGTFVNGNKIEAKRLTHVKSTDDIKIGLSDVIMQFTVLEKHFKTDYIAESLLPSHEKDNLQALIKASNHKAQEIVASAQMQADHITQVANEKARNIENQSLLKQEEIMTSAQVEGQHFVADSKRKAAQILLENEEKVKASCQSIYDQAERVRKEAEAYFQNRVKEAEARGTEIIEEHTKIGQQLVEEIKEKTAKKTEDEIRLQLASVVSEIEDKSIYLKELKAACTQFEQSGKADIEADLLRLRNEMSAQFEKEKSEKFSFIEDKIKELEQEYSDKNSNFERDYLSKTTQLDREYSEKQSKLENQIKEKTLQLGTEYSDKLNSLETGHAQRIDETEKQYSNLKTELEEQHKKNQEEAAAALIQQKQRLDSEVQTQRQQLGQLTTDLNASTQKYSETKAKLDDIEGLLKGLQNNEAELIKSLNEKREHTKKAQTELQAIKAEIDIQQQKFLTSKTSTEAQIEDYQLRLSKLKAAFEAESERLKKESEREIAGFKEEYKKAKEQLEHDLKVEKAEIHKKTVDYTDAERAKMDDYRAQMLQEKKELDQAFDKTRKEFESKTKEVIEHEKQKVEEARQSFMNNLNRERQVITDDVTISIMKIKNHEVLTASAISDAVARVFNSHVTAHSVDVTVKATNQNASRLKFQYMSYGLGLAFAGFMGFKFFIQPQINRHIAGTEEHTQAAIPVERLKYTAPQSLEYKDTYTEAVLYTQKFADIYLDEELHDKWFKHIAGYMYENWRVDETNSIEAISISKTLVQSLKDSSGNLDAEFFQKGIEKMRELEQTSEKRMIEALGTKVKYEAYKRKEREFFEPYIQNQ